MTRNVSKATIKSAKFNVIKYGTKIPILSAPQLAKVIIATRKIRFLLSLRNPSLAIASPSESPIHQNIDKKLVYQILKSTAIAMTARLNFNIQLIYLSKKGRVFIDL